LVQTHQHIAKFGIVLANFCLGSTSKRNRKWKKPFSKSWAWNWKFSKKKGRFKSSVAVKWKWSAPTKRVSQV